MSIGDFFQELLLCSGLAILLMSPLIAIGYNLIKLDELMDEYNKKLRNYGEENN